MAKVIVVNPSRHPAHPDQSRAVKEYFGEDAEISEPKSIRLDKAEDLVPHIKGQPWLFGSIPGPVAYQLGILAGKGELDDSPCLQFQEDSGSRARGRYAPDRMIVVQGTEEVARIDIIPTVEVDPRTGESFPYEGK